MVDGIMSIVVVRAVVGAPAPLREWDLEPTFMIFL